MIHGRVLRPFVRPTSRPVHRFRPAVLAADVLTLLVIVGLSAALMVVFAVVGLVSLVLAAVVRRGR